MSDSETGKDTCRASCLPTRARIAAEMLLRGPPVKAPSSLLRRDRVLRGRRLPSASLLGHGRIVH
jgi:hypothetical protein